MALARRWSQPGSGRSGALELEPDLFGRDDPAEIAASLKRSAERSPRWRTTPFRSAMSMLTFHINRAGDSLPDARREVLETAKEELRKAFGKA